MEQKFDPNKYTIYHKWTNYPLHEVIEILNHYINICKARFSI